LDLVADSANLLFEGARIAAAPLLFTNPLRGEVARLAQGVERCRPLASLPVKVEQPAKIGLLAAPFKSAPKGLRILPDVT